MTTSTKPTAVPMDIPTDILYETIIALEDRASTLRSELRSDKHADIKTIARRQLARVEMALAHFNSLANLS